MHYSRTSFTIQELYDLYGDEKLNLSPDWQRDPVWTAAKKPALIRSLFNEIPIPEITLWKCGDVYVVVDGQQRIRAILEYLSNEFKANESFYDDLTDEESDTLLETTLTVLLLGEENSEESVIAYYKLRNSTSTALTAGELLKADSKSPIIVETNRYFVSREERMNSVFGKKKEATRSADLTNRVPYLTSLLHGAECLTKSYSTLQSVIESTKQDQVDKVKDDFNKKMDAFISVCKAILDDPANARLRNKWKGFPPLGKVSTIWLTILNPETLRGRVLEEFWVQFYKKIHSDEAHAMSWENYTRKNGKVKQLHQNIEWAHKITKA